MRLLAVIVATAIPAFPQFQAFGPSGGSCAANGAAALNVYPSEVSFPPVVNAPYSARESNELIRTLVDGTHLTTHPRDDVMTWRDSSGRVRTEIRAVPGGRFSCDSVLAEIYDPIAGSAYLLDTVNHIAHRVPIAPLLQPSAAQPDPVPAKQRWTSEQLGTKTMFGVIVEGTRRSTTYAVDTLQGNDRPVTATEERWISRQLGLTVLEKTSNVSGVQTIALRDLSAAEPDASLFKVPAGYPVVEETGRFTIHTPAHN